MRERDVFGGVCNRLNGMNRLGTFWRSMNRMSGEMCPNIIFFEFWLLEIFDDVIGICD